MAVLEKCVLVELEALDAEGNPVRAIRRSWISTLEMLLEAAPREWRTAVAEYDCILAARATPNYALQQERHQAIWTIWNAYLDRQVWMSGARESPRGGDHDALIRLIRIDVPPGFVDEIRTALSSPERTVRGNAMELVPTLFDQEMAIPLVRRALADPDAVVRRQAASAALDLRAETLVDPMVEQAMRDDDKMARETLFDFAIDLAANDRAIEIALNVPPGVRDRALSSLVRKVPRADLLTRLRGVIPLDQDLLRALVEDHGMRGVPEWTADDVARLVDILAANPALDSRWDSDVDRILCEHPRSAAMAWLSHAVGDDDTWQFRRCLLGIPDSDRHEFIRVLESSSHEHSSAASGLDDPRPIDEETRAMAVAFLTDVEVARSGQASGTINEAPVERSRTTPDAAPPVADENLRLLFEEDGIATAVHPLTGQVASNTLRQLEGGAERATHLSPAEAAQLFRFLISWANDSFAVWLSGSWGTQARDLVLGVLDSLADDGLCRVATTLPSPWPAGLAHRVLDAIHRSASSESRKLLLAQSVQERTGADQVREWVTGEDIPWLDPLFAMNGDAAAELRLVQRLAATLSDISRRPRAEPSLWLDNLSCPATSEPLYAFIRTTLIEGNSQADTGALYRALNRCADLDAPRLWDQLIADDEIPTRKFLYYPRRDCVDDLVVRYHPHSSFNPPAGDANFQAIACSTVVPGNKVPII